MRRKSQERGFTLLETTIALSVMLVVGLGAASLFFYAVRYNSGAADRTNELALLQRQMETYRTLPWNSAQLNAQAATTTGIMTMASSAYGTAPTGNVGDCVASNTSSDARCYDLTTTIEDLTTYTGGPVMQKRITLSIAPRSVNGTNDWRSAPVSVVVWRSSPALGPYRQ